MCVCVRACACSLCLQEHLSFAYRATPQTFLYIQLSTVRLSPLHSSQRSTDRQGRLALSKRKQHPNTEINLRRFGDLCFFPVHRWGSTSQDRRMILFGLGCAHTHPKPMCKCKNSMCRYVHFVKRRQSQVNAFRIKIHVALWRPSSLQCCLCNPDRTAPKVVGPWAHLLSSSLVEESFFSDVCVIFDDVVSHARARACRIPSAPRTRCQLSHRHTLDTNPGMNARTRAHIR